LKRPALSLLVCSLLLAVTVQAGCGGDSEPADPYDVLNGAFAEEADRTTAEVEVASLGLEDQTLKTRTLSLNPGTYRSIREAIASPQAGLEAVVGDIETEGTEEVEGVETTHVSGKLKTDELIGALVVANQNGAGIDENGDPLPGLSELGKLQDTLVDGDFDLFAATEDGGFERLDLTLSLDDRENALPPTRIRFSLTESDPSEGSI